METRTIEQMKIYYLHLNPMTANYETINIMAISSNKDALMNWYKSLKVEPYQDGNWNKTFQRGSKLEWSNPIECGDHCGIREDWTTKEDIASYINIANNSLGFIPSPELIELDDLH